MTKTRVLVLLLSVVFWPIRADAWWGWFEEFSGPGPFNDASVSVPALCFTSRKIPIQTISDDGTKITTAVEHGLHDNQMIEIIRSDVSFVNGMHTITRMDEKMFAIPANATNPIPMKGVKPSLGYVAVIGEYRPYLCGTLFGSERDPHLSRLVEARFDRLWSYPDRPRFSDVPCPDGGCSSSEDVKGWRLNALFMVRLQPWLDAGLGAGLIRLSGDAYTRSDGRGGNSFSVMHATATPIELVLAPIAFFHVLSDTTRLTRWDRFVKVRFDETLVPGFTAADFGATTSTRSNYSTAASLLGSFTIDFDVISVLGH